MKVLIISIVITTSVLCELPPPYYKHGFRPSHQIKLTSNVRTPQYRAPNQNLNSLDVKIPSGLTIEQLIRLTEQIQHSHKGRNQQVEVNIPRDSYGVLVRQPQSSYEVRNKFQGLQSGFRPPFATQSQNLWRPVQSGVPQNTYQPPARNPNQNIPSATYGAPNRPYNSQNSNQGATNTEFGLQRPPSTSYGVPDIRSIESLGDLRGNGNNQNNQQMLFNPQTAPNLNQQYLPAKEQNYAPIQPQNSQSENRPNQSPLGNKYLTPQPINPELQNAQPQLGTADSANNNQNVFSQNPQQGNGRPNETPTVGNGYLPPKTTPKGFLDDRATTVRPQTVSTTPASNTPTSYDYEVQQTTTSPFNEDGSASDPNVAIANAVANGGNFFYLQQPDGRLQRVVLQKTQEPDGKPEEYVANYYFQNVQPLPNVVYTPLLSLGDLVQK